VLGCRGDTDGLLTIAAGGSAKPADRHTVERGEHYLAMSGSEVFRLAVRAMTQSAREALAQADLPVPAVRAVIAHQANVRILRATREALGLPAEKLFVNVDRYGNTGCASAAIALSEFLSAECVRPGEHLLLTAFGGGLSWASLVYRHADVAAVVAARHPTPARSAAGAGGSGPPRRGSARRSAG
jgi:3-oxoacyl-[acyl-carrier-protein] synthase-3